MYHGLLRRIYLLERIAQDNFPLESQIDRPYWWSHGLDLPRRQAHTDGSKAATNFSRSRGHDLLSILLHECCHAIMFQRACTGACGSARFAGIYDRQVDLEDGHGSAWVRLARGAEGIANLHKLLDSPYWA